MFTFGFFAKCFFSGLLIACLLGSCIEQFQFEETLVGKITYWILNILCLVTFGCVVISIFGMIWTF
jgi:hypothetical protein